MDDLATRIRVLRQRKHLTQPQLAEKMGLDKSTVAHWERGASRPRRIEDVAKALGFTASAFYAAKVA